MDSSAPPLPETEPSSEHRFPCSACGGEMRYDAESQGMRCTHCESTAPIPPSQEAIRELDLKDTQRAGLGKGYDTQVTSIHCDSCGAVTAFGGASTASKCAFCGSSQIRPEADLPDVIRPASLIPFKIQKDDALARFSTWMKKKWFKPNDLAKTYLLKEINGIYLPYWTFDAEASSSWNAMAGYHYYVNETYTEMEDGQSVTKTRRVQKTRWQPASGAHHGSYDDELVCASKGVEPKLAARLGGFDTHALVAYQAHYLSGWGAERYQIDLDEGWTLGRASLQGKEETACGNMVPGDTYKQLRVSTRFSDVTFKHTLLPVWVAAYHYKDTLYQFLVNGQSGKVSGSSPTSWIKVTFAVVTALAIIGAIAYFVSTQQ